MVAGLFLIAVVIGGCDAGNAGVPDQVSVSPSTTAPGPAVPPAPWALDDLTDRPCSVLGPEDIARFVLDPVGLSRTPPESLPSCTWFSIQTSAVASFNIRFAPQSHDSSDLGRRIDPGPLERQITIAGRRAVISPTAQPDGNNGLCAVYVAVPSGGSYYLGIAAGGIHHGVTWDVCAKTIDVATVIADRLR